jgi:3D (Asp-Asp-Asp) domain-containing protein
MFLSSGRFKIRDRNNARSTSVTVTDLDQLLSSAVTADDIIEDDDGNVYKINQKGVWSRDKTIATAEVYTKAEVDESISIAFSDIPTVDLSGYALTADVPSLYAGVHIQDTVPLDAVVDDTWFDTANQQWKRKKLNSGNFFDNFSLSDLTWSCANSTYCTYGEGVKQEGDVLSFNLKWHAQIKFEVINSADIASPLTWTFAPNHNSEVINHTGGYIRNSNGGNPKTGKVYLHTSWYSWDTFIPSETAVGALVTASIDELKGIAPEALDTIQELATAIQNSDSTVTDILTTQSNKANSVDVYTKTETDALSLNKANSVDVYTKTETDALSLNKANSVDVYTKTETDALSSDKANSVDVYTKTEIDALSLNNAVDVDGNVYIGVADF